MRKELASAMVALSCVVSGCMNVSPNQAADVDKLQNFQIQKGVTTKADLVAQFGPAPTDTEASDGTEMMTWSKTHIDIDTGSVMLAAATSGLAGMGHGSGHSCILQVTLRNGIVVDYTRTLSDRDSRD